MCRSEGFWPDRVDFLNLLRLNTVKFHGAANEIKKKKAGASLFLNPMLSVHHIIYLSLSFIRGTCLCFSTLNIIIRSIKTGMLNALFSTGDSINIM